jgi:hypothetical protein
VSYRLTVRRGPEIEKESRATLGEALDLLEAYTTTATRQKAVEFVNRRYEPGDLVAMRIELRGDGVRAGLDVHGDGSATAWTGRFRRTAIEPLPGESPLKALRRTLAQSVKVVP